MINPKQSHAEAECGAIPADSNTVTCTTTTYTTPTNNITYGLVQGTTVYNGLGVDGLTLNLNDAMLRIRTSGAGIDTLGLSRDISRVGEALPNLFNSNGDAVVVLGSPTSSAPITINATRFDTITTTNQRAHGLLARHFGSGDVNVTLAAGTITTMSFGAHGVSASTANLPQATLNGNATGVAAPPVPSVKDNEISILMSGGGITSGDGGGDPSRTAYGLHSHSTSTGEASIGMGGGIITNGDSGHGVLASSFGILFGTFSNATATARFSGGSITTSGNFSHGVSADTDNNSSTAIMNGNGVITASGRYSRGVFALQRGAGGTARMELFSGSITTTGDGSSGLYMWGGNGGSTATITAAVHGGSIETSGGSGRGVQVRTYGMHDIAGVTMSGGTIQTGGANGTAAEAYGLFATNNDSATTASLTAEITGGSITTRGPRGHGVALSIRSTSGTASATFSGGSIRTAGETARGLLVVSSGTGAASASISGDTTITATGRDADGVRIASASGTFDLDITGGQITSGTDAAAAIHSFAAGGGDFLQFNNLSSGDFTLTGSDATGFSGTHSAITGGFRGVNSLAANDPLTGGAVHNLIGLNRNATWTSDSQGIRYAVTEGTTTRSLGLFHFEQFTGGTGNDTFNVGFNDDIDINGGAGDDRFNLSGLITGNLTGGPGDDVLTLTLNTGGFLNGNANLGAGDDTLTLNTGGSITGNVSLGADSDTLSYANRSTAVSVTLASSAANGFTTTMGGATGITGTVSDINTLTGGTGMDTLTGYDADATWTLGRTGNSGSNTYAVTVGTGNSASTRRLTFAGFENLTGSAMVDNFTITGSHTGNLSSGAEDDVFTLSDNAMLTGNIDTGDGDDTVTVGNMASGASIVGNITLGDGDDTLTIANAAVRISGLADGGPGMDTLNGLELFREASASTIFSFVNFENVNGETELLTNLPVVAITENNGARGFAPRPVAPVVPPVVPMPQPPAPVVPPVVPPMPITPVNPMPVAPVGPMPPATGTDSQPITPPPPGTPTPGTGTGTGTTTPPTPGTGTGTGTTPPPTGGTGTPPPLTTGTGTGTTTPPTPGTGTGTGTTPPPTGGTATPPPPSPTDFAVLAAAYCEATGTACQPATATRPATVTPTPPALPDPTTLPDEPARAAARDRFQSQVESYVYVDPTGPSVQASAVGALTTTINTLISQRLSAYRRAARPPVQVAATALLPGMLARGEDPLIWGELFASDRQRGRDGRTLSYSHEYRGVLFGAEQRYGQEAVLGLMLGYADADVSTHITALNVETGSLFGGVYGRLDLAGLAVDVGLNLGYEEHDNQRFIPQQRQTAETSTHSFFINPSLTVSQSYRVEALSGRATFRLTPSLSMSYTAAFYGDYTERGAAGFNLSVDSRTAHNLTTRLQLGGDWALPKSNSGLGLRLGLQSRFTDSSDFEGTLSGASFSYASDADKSVHSLYVGVDGRHELRDNLKLLVDVEYNHDVGEVSERALSGIVRFTYWY